MHLHTETWGHVSYATATPGALELAEEAHETRMLTCRYGRRTFLRSYTALCKAFTGPHEVIFNPNTLSDVGEIFRRYLDKPILQ